ncbi:hypothetical protein E4U51_005082 [Claviceps purpurea]|nr:hypothetical protein E4U51_005082 [Claviceps purpurea]
MATTHRSVLRSSLEDTIASLASVFPLLTTNATKNSDVICEHLSRLHDELRWIFGVVCGLHRLVQHYEDGGLIFQDKGPYLVLERWMSIFEKIRELSKDITLAHLQSSLRSLEPCLDIVPVVCDNVYSLYRIRSTLMSDICPPQPPNEPLPATGLYLSSLRDAPFELEPDQSNCPQQSSLGENSSTVPSDATVLQWMRELNFRGQNRPPLELFPDLCLARARNQQRPLYRIAASQWYLYADSKWSVIRREAEHLVSEPQRHNFFNWVLEFARTRIPHHPGTAGEEERASRIIELTDELERGHLTPMHMTCMLGMTELCKYLLAEGAFIISTGAFGSPLHCALLGPKVLLQMRQPLSWSTVLREMEPANDDIINAILADGEDCDARMRILLETPEGATLASIAFVASVKTRNPELFQKIMEHSGTLDQSFSFMLTNLFPDEIPPDLAEFMAMMYAVVLGHNLVPDRTRFHTSHCPWNGQDDIGLAILGILRRNRLSLSRITATPIPTTNDEDFHRMVEDCILHGNDMYLQRLALDSRFSPNLRYKSPWLDNGTLVHAAVLCRQAEMLTTLASYNADMYAVDARGRTPLMVSENVQILRLLVENYHVSTESTDADGRNIWHYVAATNDLTLSSWLCKNDPSREANINSITKQGHSPLIESLMYINTLVDQDRRQTAPRPDVVYLLLEQDYLDINKGSSKLPIGHLAAQWGELRMVNTLAEKGLNFAVLDDEGRSPLHHLNTSCEEGLAKRLLELCGGLSSISKAGVTSLESLYANSFLTEPGGGGLSRHPSSFHTLTEESLEPLLTREVLDAHNEAGEGCWARFCNTSRQLLERCSKIEGGVPDAVELSIRAGVLALHKKHALKAYEEETGRSALLCLASLHEDGTTSWSLQTNPMVRKVLPACIAAGLTLFFRTQSAFELMAEALNLGDREIIFDVAQQVPLHEPAPSFGGMTMVEYAMRLKVDEVKSFPILVCRGHITAEEVNSIGSRLCHVLLEPSLAANRAEALICLLFCGLCPNTTIRTEVPDKDTTLLSEAIANDFLDIFAILLERDADPGAGRTDKAITTALLPNKTVYLPFLLDRLKPDFDWNFTVSFEGVPGFNAIDFAIQAQAHEALETLFSSSTIKTIIHSRSDINRGTPAHLAARRNDIRSIEILQRNGADLGRVDDSGQTILDIAAAISSPELMDLAAKFCSSDTRS